MARAQVVEIAAVNGGDGGDAMAFGDSHQRSVGAAQSPIGVLPDEFRHPPQVGIREVHRAESVCGLAADRIEELSFGGWATEPVNEVAGFGQDGDRKRQIVRCTGEPAQTAIVFPIGAIRQRDDDVGVYQNHNDWSATESIGEQVIDPLG